eukprot:11196929-Lingulodinium_polyedra.AAC.1
MTHGMFADVVAEQGPRIIQRGLVEGRDGIDPRTLEAGTARRPQLAHVLVRGFPPALFHSRL